MKRIVCLMALTSVMHLGCAPQAPQTVQNTTPEPVVTQQVAKAVASKEVVAAPTEGKLVSTPVPEGATLKIKFVLDGEAPEFANHNGSRDPYCAPLKIPSEVMLVGDGGELQNVAMILDARRSKAKIPDDLPAPTEEQVTLDNDGCLFKPHILIVRPGQTIHVTNSDECGHNANFTFMSNKAENFLIPAGGSKDKPIKTSEVVPMPVECNIHPWMKAYLIIQDHPYVGLSDESGEITIENLPVGDVTIKIWHENSVGSIDEITINGEKQRCARGRMALTLEPGMNDLGTAKISVKKFKDGK